MTTKSFNTIKDSGKVESVFHLMLIVIMDKIGIRDANGYQRGDQTSQRN